MAGQLTSINDRTGASLAKALVPAGWVTGGDRFDDPTQTYRSVIAAARAAAPDGSVSMFVQTGEEFLEVIRGAGLDEKHAEDQIDPYFGIMMRRYLMKDEYLDKIALALAGGTGLTLEAETEIPLIGGVTAEEFDARIKEAVDSRARIMTGGEYAGEPGGDPANWRFILKHIITSHPIRQYRFSKERQQKVLILTADLFAYDYDLEGNGSGALSSLPGGLLGRGTGSYISWGCTGMGAVIADADKAVEARQVFFRFAASFQWVNGQDDRR